MEPPLAPGRLYRFAWWFYLLLAVAGAVWIGARRGTIPLALFVDRRLWPLDVLLGVAAAGLLVGLWRLGRRLPAARELEASLGGLLGPLDRTDVAGLALLSGFAEELFFRGAVQDALGWLPAVLLFALLHSGPGRPFRLWSVFAIAAGLLFGGLTLWRGNLLAAVVGHVLVNAVNLRELVDSRPLRRERKERP
ncbi:MAG TPA: CPBP family intramembrane glutamic endopeptidase [Thermoanaerobaculia bacterium]|nr:CPBP family intramembrane glutamic endopeptidase [Thermoanaerobaculia bacterium]